MDTEKDFLLSSYHFNLPEEQIAQFPAKKRGESRLMVMQRSTGEVALSTFAELLSYLPAKSLLVVNNSKVIPARIYGKRPSGGQVEFLLLTPPPLMQTTTMPNEWQCAKVEGLLRSSKKIAIEETIYFSPNFSLKLLKRGDFGKCSVMLHWQGDFLNLLNALGQLPLPPYIRRKSKALPQSPIEQEEQNKQHMLDNERYQTIYAHGGKAGSVAAPTAGLHFSEEMKLALEKAGHEWVEVTLYVGYGTFSPVRSTDIRHHEMHAEYAELSDLAAKSIAKAKAEGRPVIAIGTTSARTLEGLAAMQNTMHMGNEQPKHSADNLNTGLSNVATEKINSITSCIAVETTEKKEIITPLPHAGWINIFLYPGKEFKVIDGLLTNFHLPESTLLMLVSAFAGRENTLNAYKLAVENKFRFFSYGDAMLII